MDCPDLWDAENSRLARPPSHPTRPLAGLMEIGSSRVGSRGGPRRLAGGQYALGMDSYHILCRAGKPNRVSYAVDGGDSDP